jgi:hypothetical protein
MRSRKRASTERALSILLDALAFELIQLDITPGRVSEILRTSFVKAGATLSRRKSSGRPHIARIAAVTGLSRLEVKRIIDAKYKHDDVRGEQEPRVLRVVRAWQGSPPYAKSIGKSPLKVSGRHPSFESLCKEHSGDIPHMAIVAELKSRGLVRVTRQRGQDYIALNLRSRLTNSKSVDTLQFVAALFDSVVREDQVLVKQMQHVSVPRNLAPTYFENSVAERMSALVEQLQIDPDQHRHRGTRRDGLDVFAVVSRRRRENKK